MFDPTTSIGSAMHKIIIADNQAIYRTGLAKLLATEDENHLVAQCSDCARLLRAVKSFRGATVIVASTLAPDFAMLTLMMKAANSRMIVIAENIESYRQYTSQGATGVIFRGTTSAVLVDCVRRVGAGDTAVRPIGVPLAPEQEDHVGANVQARLETKELKIVSLLVQGMKNKEIADRFNTTEQVVKNVLRGIFDKTGVSDRLELALFIFHHRVLAAAVAEVGATMELETVRS
jgi:DNA-binding NarL/FixJ family response regulator